MSAYLGQNWQCPSCQAWNEPDTLACARCGAGAPYPTLAEAQSGAAGVAYLLGELEKWRDQGLITPAAYETLHNQYQERHRRLARVPRVERLLQDARYANGQGKVDEALRLATEARELDPESDRALELIGILHEQRGSLDEALACYETLARLRPNSREAAERVRYIRGAIEAVRGTAEERAELDAIRVRYDAGERPEAEAACREFLRAHPGSAGACALQASFLRDGERAGDALSLLERAVSLRPGDPELLRELQAVRAEVRAQAERERGERNRARAAQLAADARALLDKGDVSGALAACREAADLEPDLLAAYTVAGEAFERSDYWRGAETAWEEAFRLEPGNADYAARREAAGEKRRLAERPPWVKLWDALSSAAGAFMEAHNVSWLLLVSVSVFVASSIGLAAWAITEQRLWGVVGRSITMAIGAATTGGCWAAGRRRVGAHRATGLALMTVASLLLPLDLVLLKQFFPGAAPVEWRPYAALIAAVTTSAAADLAVRYRARRFVALGGVAFLAVVCLFVDSHRPEAPGVYAFWLSIVGLGYLLGAQAIRRGEHAELAAPLDLLAHVVMAGSLAAILAPGLLGAVGTGSTAVRTALVIGTAYFASAYVAGQAHYVPVFCTLFLVTVSLFLKQRGAGVEEWYHYGLAFGALGSAFLAVGAPLSRRSERERFATWYEGYGLAATAGVLLLLFGRGLLEALLYLRLPVGRELTVTCQTAFLIGLVHLAAAVLVPRPKLLYGSAAGLSYGMLLLARLMGRPPCEYSIWLMAAAAACVGIGHSLRGEREEYAQPPWRAGQVLAAGSALLALALWLSHGVLPALRGGAPEAGYREAAFVVLLLAAWLFACVAHWSEEPRMVYAAAAGAVLAWGAAVSWLDERALGPLLGAERNYGAYFLPAAAALLVVGRSLRRRRQAAYAVPCEEAAFELGGAALLAQAYLAAAAPGLRHSIWMTLVAYGAGFAWAAARFGDGSSRDDAASEGGEGTAVAEDAAPFGWWGVDAYVVLSALSLLGALVYGLGGAGVPRGTVALLVAAAGGAGAGCLAEEMLRRDRRCLVRPLLAVAGVVFTAALVYAVAGAAAPVLIGGGGVAALAVALVYARPPEKVLPRALPLFGAGILVGGAVPLAVGDRTALLPMLLSAGAVGACGALYTRLARRVPLESYAYVAVVALGEAGVLAASALLAPLVPAGVQRLSFILLGAAALWASSGLARREGATLARASLVVGHAFLGIGILTSLFLWLTTLSGIDRGVALAAALIGGGVYAASAAAFRSPLALYAAAACLGAAWLVLFDDACLGSWIPGVPYGLAGWRALAGLAGLAWSFAGYRACRAAARRAPAEAEPAWWARPALDTALGWTAASLAWGLRMDEVPLAPALAACALACVHYSLVATERDSRRLGAVAAAGFVLACLWAAVGAEYAGPGARQTLWWGASTAVAAGCMAWLTARFRSREFCALATLGASASFLFFAEAVLAALGPAGHGGLILPLALLAWVMQGAAMRLRRLTPDLAAAPALAGDIAAGVAFFAALPLSLSAAAADVRVGAVVLGLVSGAYALSAWGRGLPWLLYPSGLSAAIGLGMAGPTLLQSLPDPNYGLLYLPFAAAVAALGYTLRARGSAAYAEPLLHVAFVASLFCLALQPSEAALGTRPAIAAGILLGLAALYAGASCMEGCDPRRVAWLVGLGCLTLAGAVLAIPLPALRARLPLAMVLLAAAWTGLGWLLRRRRLDVWATPLLAGAACLAGLAGLAAGALAEAPRLEWDAGTLLAATAVLFWVAAVSARPSVVDAACGAAALGTLGLLFTASEPAVSHKWACLAPVLAAAVGSAGMALRRAWRENAVWSPFLLALAVAGYVFAIPSQALLPETPAGALLLAATAACAWMYSRLSREPALAALAWAAPVCGALSYWYALALGHRLAGLPDPVHYVALSTLPCVLALGWVEVRADGGKPQPMGRPNVAVGLALSILGLAAGAPLLWGEPALLSLALLLHAAAHAAGAGSFRCEPLAWLACVTLSAAWVHTAWRTLGWVADASALGLCVSALGLLFLAAGLALRRAEGQAVPEPPDPTPVSGLQPPVHLASAPLAFAAGAAGCGAILAWSGVEASAAHAPAALAALALSALVYGAFAYVRNSWAYVSAANAALILSWRALYLALDLGRGGLPGSGAWFALLGALQVAIGVALHRGPVRPAEDAGKGALPAPARVQYAVGVFISSLAAVVALLGTPAAQGLGHWTVIALLLSAASHFVMAAVFRQVGYVHASFAAALASLYLVFYGKLDLKSADMLNVYCLPLGLYFILLPWVHRLVGREIRPEPAHAFGLLLLLGSGLIALVEHGFRGPGSILLLLESIAALVYGLHHRLKAFFFSGLGFSLAWAGVLAYHAVFVPAWAAHLPVLPVMGFIVAALVYWAATRAEEQWAQTRQRFDEWG